MTIIDSKVSSSAAILMAAIVLSIAGSFLSTPVLAQNETTIGYSSSYAIDTGVGVSKPLTINIDQHLYHSGETVQVSGSLWSEIVDRVDILDQLKVEITDGKGNVVAQDDASVTSDGQYSSSLNLLDSAEAGTYTVETRLELEADALGIIKAITSASLQSSMEFAVANPQDHPVSAESENFTVSIASNSGINDFEFKQQDKKVSFFVEGEAGTTGVTEITIPKRLLSGEMSVFMDQNVVAKEDVLVKSDTATETTFEINYHHSIHRMEVAGTNVVPEFPIAIAVMAASIASIIAAATIMTRKHHSIQ